MLSLGLLVGMSIVVYRLAGRAGRRKWLWVVNVWVATIFGGFVGAWTGGRLALVAVERGSYEGVLELEYGPIIYGMALGALLCIAGAGRQSRKSLDVAPPNST
jgi:hypothetical protein